MTWDYDIEPTKDAIGNWYAEQRMAIITDAGKDFESFHTRLNVLYDIGLDLLRELGVARGDQGGLA